MSYLGQEIPKLGFGFMRIPTKGQDVDMEQLNQMVDIFMEKGFTYFDTAWFYMNGLSEKALRESVVKRYPRESFQIATKLPAWAAADEKGAKQMFWDSMERLGVDYVDYFLLHNLGSHRTEAFDKYHIWEFLAEQKAQGRIRHLGFSIHDSAKVLDEVLTAHPDMDFVQLQINFADWERPGIESRKCYETAMKHKKPVIVMEPVKGGSLVSMPEHIKNIFKTAKPDMSIASWAVRYAASLDNIITVLSGMSNLEQLKDNVSYMENFKPLSAEEMKVIENVQKALDQIPSVPCTDCRYCMKDCPKGIKIANIFTAVNRSVVFNDKESAKGNYSFETSNGGKGSECIECGNCENVCPQHIEIIKELKKAVAMFE